MQKVVIEADQFKTIIKEISRFKQSSALAGSELVYMRKLPDQGLLRLYGGVSVVARTACSAQGEMSCVAVDSRTLQPYAERITEAVTISISSKNKLILFRSGAHDLDVPLLEGPADWPKAKTSTEFGQADESDSAALRYLAAMVPDVQTRPDLAAIAIKDGQGIASSQRSAAVIKLTKFNADGFIPAPLARDLVDSDYLYSSKDETTLRNGHAVYSMALPAEINSFPIEAVFAMLAGKKSRMATCDGTAFAEAMIACRDCLGFISKLGAFVEMTPRDGKLQLLAQSGSTTYKTRIDADIRNTDVKLYAPIEDAVNFSPLCTGALLSFSRGTQNGELFIESEKLKIVVASGRVEE